MKRILQDTTMRLAKQNRCKLLLIFLTAIVASCAGAPEFPTRDLWETHIRVYDNTDGTKRLVEMCRQYDIYDPENFKFRHVRDWPLVKCHGVFGFSTSDAPKIFDWAEDMQDHVKKECSK